MADFKIVTQEVPNGVNPDGTPLLVTQYSFLVDGVPSLLWANECHVQGLPKTYYIDRVIGRLKEGRSAAFGAAAVKVGDQVFSAPPGKTVRASVVQKAAAGAVKFEAAPGGTLKPREPRPSWTYVLDGTESKETFPTEQAAKTACAIKAFMTRGKLGRLDEVRAILTEKHPGKECKVFVCPRRHAVVATVSGVPHAVGIDPSTNAILVKPC